MGNVPLDLPLGGEVNGQYDVLVKVSLAGKSDPADACLRAIEFETTTALNSKTQPKLLLGSNIVYVGAGGQTQSIVLWPDLQGEEYKPYVVEQRNMTSKAEHPGYQGVMHAVNAKEDAYVVFKVDAPTDITRIEYVGRWVRYGRNLAAGKPYTVSVPSATRWEAGDPQGTKLTDGVVGPPCAGGIGPRYGLCWDQGAAPAVTVDLGRVERCAAFRIQLSAGWPWWDALKGEVKDAVEVLTSTDGKDYASRGLFDLNLRWKDIPINHMMPDDETATGYTYTLTPPQPADARYIQYKITAKRTVTVSEVQVLDSIDSKPFDLRIALPEE